MKKIFIFIVAFITMLSLLSCSKKVSLDPKKPITITIWHYYTSGLKTTFEDMIAEFNQTVGNEKGIILKAEYQEDIDILTEKIIASAEEKIGTKDLPDMIFAYTGTVYDLDKRGLISNIEPYFTRKELEQYLPSYIEEGRIGNAGELKSFPVAKSSEIIYINNNDYMTFKNAVNKSGNYTPVDDVKLQTFEGIMEIAETYYKWTDDSTPTIKGDGKAFFGFDATPNYISIGARQLAGPPITLEDNKPVFTMDEATAKKLWEYYYYGILTGQFAEVGRYRADDMKTGELIAYIGSTGGARYFPSEVVLEDKHTHKTELAVAKYPVFQGSKAVAIQQGAGISIIKTEEKRQMAAAEFLKWFTNPSQNVTYSFSSGYSPVMKEEYVKELETEALNHLLSKKDTESHNIAQVLELASTQFNEYELSVDKEYKGSFDVRNMLGNTLSESAKQARMDLLADLEKGEDYEELVRKYMDEQRFQEWYARIQSEFNQMTQ